jgi:vitamin B12/bleomycin/antimicrobial peptide transport system ATP-binding/permease protein
LYGSLRQQVVYATVINETDSTASAEDPYLLELLQRVQLQSLATQVGGLDAESDWSKVLSLGEQQRLAFARVLYNKPRVVFLDGKEPAERP